VPPGVIESGRIELVTPIGSVTVPFQGIMNPRPDGSLAAAIDVQAQSEHATLRGGIKLVAADGAIDADLTIEDGTITIAQTLSTTFTGDARLIWVSTGTRTFRPISNCWGLVSPRSPFPQGESQST
jgi:hypothetical protein